MSRFFFELLDPVVLIGVHDPKTLRFLQCDFQHRDRTVSAFLLMVIQHLLIIHTADLVTGQYNDVVRIIIVNEIDILINGIGSSAVPVSLLASHIRRKNKGSSVHIV